MNHSLPYIYLPYRGTGRVRLCSSVRSFTVSTSLGIVFAKRSYPQTTNRKSSRNLDYFVFLLFYLQHFARFWRSELDWMDWYRVGVTMTIV